MSGAIVGYGGSVNSETGVRRWSITHSVKAVDCTSMSSGGVREVKAGISQWEGEIEMNEAPTFAVGTIVGGTFSTGSAGISGSAVSYSGSMLVTSIRPETPYDDQVVWRVGVTGDGALS